MILTLEPTDRIERIEGADCRVWTGTTDSGVPVRAMIRCVSPQTHEPNALARFETELRELSPLRPAGIVVDMRFVV